MTTMKRLILVTVAALLLSSPVWAQTRPSVVKQTANPQGTSCTAGTSPIIGYDSGATALWYYCNTSTGLYTVVGTGVGDMLTATYDPSSRSGSKVITHATDCSAQTTWCDVAAESGYFCVDLDDAAAWICDGSSWTQLPGSGGGGDMTKAVYDTDANSVVDSADAVAWADITGMDPTFSDGTDDDTIPLIETGVIVTTGQAVRVQSTGPTVSEGYTPVDPVTNATDLHASTTVESALICQADGTNCPEGVTDTYCGDGAGDFACTLDDDDFQIPGGTVTHATASDKCAKFNSSGVLIAATGDCAAGDTGGSSAPDDATYIVQTADATLSAEQALDALSDGILKHSSGVVAQAVKGTDYAGVDNANTFTAAQQITAAAPTFKFNQDDGGGSGNDAWVSQEADLFRIQHYVGASPDATASPYLFNITAPNSSLVVDASGRVGLGTGTPGYSIHSYVASGSRYFKVQSDDDIAGLLIQGVQTVTDGTFGQLLFYNSTDTVANIMANRLTANDQADLRFQVQATSPGTLATRVTISPTAMTLASGTHFAMGSNNLTGGGSGTFAGTVAAGAFSVAADATDGQYVTLLEGVDDGSNSFTLSVPASGITATRDCEVTADAYIPFACFDPDMAAAWTGAQDFSAGTLEIASGTSRPGTCSVGMLFQDTDADTDGSLYICRATNTWKEVDDDGAAGGAPTNAQYWTAAADATLSAEVVVNNEATLESAIGSVDLTTSTELATGLATQDACSEITNCTPSAITASSSDTLTNKTWDCNGTGNSCANIDLSADVTGQLPAANVAADVATQAEIDLKANIAGPTFTGNVVIETQAATDNDTSAASTAYVKDAIPWEECFTLADTDGLATVTLNSVFKFTKAVTITAVSCEADAATDITMNLAWDNSCDTAAASTSYVETGGLQCGTTMTAGSIDTANDNFAAGDCLDLAVTAVTAAVQATICASGTYD